jgi:hypothetical protein
MSNSNSFVAMASGVPPAAMKAAAIDPAELPATRLKRMPAAVAAA